MIKYLKVITMNEKINKNVISAKKFEELIHDLFKKIGYTVEAEKKIANHFADMVITSNNNDRQQYKCEIKFSTKINLSTQLYMTGIKQLENIMNATEKGILIINCLCSHKYKEDAQNKSIIIIDLSNLLFLMSKGDELYRKFLELLDFSVSNVLPQQPPIFFKEVEKIKEEDDTLELKNRLQTLNPGKKEFSEYEKLCTDILKILFSDSLYKWKNQQKTNNGLFRFDLICKIKSNIEDDFFWTANNYFNTRYIVFEFKNYKQKITQQEIYTTEKYLYEKALRKIAIIISRKGTDKNAMLAIKGCLREQGKLIISLTDEDLINMLNLHYKHENPAEYLSEKMDTLLIELDK